MAEGYRVQACDFLLRLDETASLTNKRDLYMRQQRLEATEAQLLAKFEERDTLVFPDHLNAARGRSEVEAILASQTLALNISRRALSQDLTLLQRNSDALEGRKVGYDTQLQSHRGQLNVLRQERAAKRTEIDSAISARRLRSG